MGYRGTSLMRNMDFESACLFHRRVRNFSKNACPFLKRLTDFPGNGCLSLKKIRVSSKNACLSKTPQRKRSVTRCNRLQGYLTHERHPPSKHECLFLKKIRNSPRNPRFKKKKRNSWPEKYLFLIRTVSYDRGTPVGNNGETSLIDPAISNQRWQ